MYYVYIIRSEKNGDLYKGYTADIKKRISEHNTGKARSTRALSPWRLVYLESFINKADALREEKFLKSGKGKERLKYLLDNTLEESHSGLVRLS